MAKGSSSREQGFIDSSSPSCLTFFLMVYMLSLEVHLVYGCVPEIGIHLRYWKTIRWFQNHFAATCKNQSGITTTDCRRSSPRSLHALLQLHFPGLAFASPSGTHLACTSARTWHALFGARSCHAGQPGHISNCLLQ